MAYACLTFPLVNQVNKPYSTAPQPDGLRTSRVDFFNHHSE